MDIRQITPRYYVAPQIEASDMQFLAEAGFTHVIDNRPDSEVGPEHQSGAMQTAADEAGLEFVINPLTMETMSKERQIIQREQLDSTASKVLAYCRSGTRSTICWALAHAGDLPAEDILEAAAQAGYDLSGLAPHLKTRGEEG